jgi:hypothetical protein
MRGALLTIATTASSPGSWLTETRVSEQLWICGAAEPACSSAILLGDYTRTMHSEGTVGHDGMWTEMSGWSFDGKIDGKRLVLSRHDGIVPDEQRDELGAHRLVMPSER